MTETIVVWFSCGAASAVAAKKTIEIYGEAADVRVVNNPVAEEHEDNRRFLKDVSKWIGKPIEIATNPKYPNATCQEVWEDRRFMSGPTGAPCTIELKKRARQHWETENHADWHVLGFTADEIKRYDRFCLTERDNVIPVLIDEDITKDDCYREVMEAGIRLPEIYHLGYPNANCIGCVKATSATYWNHVRKMHPEVFEARAKFSREIGCKLVRSKQNGQLERIFLDELDPNEKGNSMKTMNIECGIFCEERE